MLLETLPADARRVAVIGVAKNAGKTTALNALLAEADAAGRTVGVLSVGVDGEAHDAISGAPKPPVRVPRGTLVCTAEATLRTASAGVEILDGTGIHTPLGELLVVRVTRPGNVVLAGVRHRDDVRSLLLRLEPDVALSVVDGAFDRTAAADPATTDCVILATGLVLAPTAEGCAEKTASLVRRLRLPVAGPGERVPPELADAAALRATEGWRAAPAATLSGPWPRSEARFDAVYQPGLVSDATLLLAERLLEPGGLLVARDPTRVLASDAALRRFARGRRIACLDGVRLAAVTVNPTRHDGTAGDSAALARTVAARLPGTPVIDVRTWTPDAGLRC
ncbi:MAG: hypothetical protein H6698_08265 [Myxococcales bacterium]|nr:hypothetical protein [Myxococcales bacterium]MCB9531126.1 hypothetical protein [Myxococcales bacterium]MCB9534283.1 hypothetical protein [Myxococcales bacterium]